METEHLAILEKKFRSLPNACSQPKSVARGRELLKTQAEILLSVSSDIVLKE